MSHVHVLDTTLRDGACDYTVDFRFTAADTARVCAGLEAAGFHYIECGHGCGLRAEAGGYPRAAATDLEYLRAARDSLKKASFGMFCLPGITLMEDVEMCADNGAGFIRIGTEPAEVAKMEPFVAFARRLGLEVMTNFMKSYVVPPAEFARAVKRAESFGAEVAYIVDSAGTMLPHEVAEYVQAVREVSDLPIGFHGHNNLGMAVANSLRAAEAGATLVDSSLQGLGRSAGNAMSEMLVAALDRRGYQTGVDLLGTLRLGYQLTRALRPTQRILPLDLLAGYTGFHSSYLPRLLKVAAAHDVDPALLMIEVCAVDQVKLRDDVLEEIAARLAGTGRPVGEYGEDQDDRPRAAAATAPVLRRRVRWGVRRLCPRRCTRKGRPL